MSFNSSGISSESNVSESENIRHDADFKSRFFIVMNTNTRSLAPKMESLADCMAEIEADISIVSETWMQNRAVEGATIDAAGEHGLDSFVLNRSVVAANGRQYGGVAVFGRAASTKLSTVEIDNPENFEVLCVAGKVNRIKEKVVVVAVYIPPNYTRVKANACLDYVADVVSEAKRRYESPLITVAGDWNQWDVKRVLDEHPDMAEVAHGPTRGERKIDKFLVNFSRSIIESDVLPPLDDGYGRQSDHSVAFFKAKFKVEIDKKVSYKYRHYTDEGARSFQGWIAGHSFDEVYSQGDVNLQLEAFLATLESKMDLFFPYKTTVRRERDPPWINPHVRALIRKRRKVYHREGRSVKWKGLMKKVRKLVRKRASKYWEYQKRNLLAKDAGRTFFKNVKSYNCKERPPQFDVRSLFPGNLSDADISEKLADHFNGISMEFDGLDPGAVPMTYSSPVQILTQPVVANRLRKFKKPKSMVRHDIFPSLVSSAADFLAGPLSHIYNTISTTSTWPLLWKQEFVTPIPKKTLPSNLNDLRNISCTALFSKVYESFVLGWIGEQVGMRSNQMGGMKGAGTEHYLVELYQLILEALEDSRAASVITSIDYSKAFNRLDFLHCLEALAAKGASTEIIAIIGSFLTSRTMSVKVGQSLSKPRIVLGGVPQGSILGVFLFNATIDSFEAASRDIVSYPLIGGGSAELAPPPEHDRSLDTRPEREYDRPGFKAWESLLLSVLKYVDDNIIHEKVCMDGMVIDENGEKKARATRSQNLFRQITRIAELLGMKVNADKTMVLCISDSRTYKATAYIEDASGTRISSVDALKILGLNFSRKPDMSAQVEAVCRKFRARIWTLRHLHHRGLSQEDLLRVYKSTILPCHNYCSNVFHSSLTLSQSIVLERLQSKALKAIYGYDPSYRDLMERAGLTTLRARREQRELTFARKCASSERFSCWFPVRAVARNTREGVTYEEKFARTHRCYNSPIFSMRRRLNEDRGMVEERAREGWVAEGLQTARA